MIKLIIGLAKYIIFIFNFIFVIFGALLILYGLLPIVNGGYDSSYGKIAIAVGTLVFIISFLGCCGAVRENKNLLTAHAAILFVLFLIQMLIVMIAIAETSDTKGIDDKLDKFIYSQDKHRIQYIREIEKWLECCGVRNSTDYTNRGMPLPGSCCGESEDVDSNNQRTCTPGIEYKDGCGPKLRNYIDDNYEYISLMVIGSSIFEIFGGIFILWTRDHLGRR
ncbi:leukocyte surface antigen CD53-like [Harmonia axyridis]|uniref:leukocyte surface antigen CD53-like n=1 Tax=Harmonia axyridis TaxID=115357 RepID=UPI001E27635F|nr:leukocyte surface antigen CD53-like [Harmonia axyridis]